jgi:microtubule-associated protein-like 1/2
MINIIRYNKYSIYIYIIFLLGTNTITKQIRNLHEGSVFSMCVLKDGNIISGGGKDGRIILLDASLKPIGLETQV